MTTHEIELSAAHELMREELGVDSNFLAMGAQQYLEQHYNQYDAQRRGNGQDPPTDGNVVGEE